MRTITLSLRIAEFAKGRCRDPILGELARSDPVQVAHDIYIVSTSPRLGLQVAPRGSKKLRLALGGWIVFVELIGVYLRFPD